MMRLSFNVLLGHLACEKHALVVPVGYVLEDSAKLGETLKNEAAEIVDLYCPVASSAGSG